MKTKSTKNEQIKITLNIQPGNFHRPNNGNGIVPGSDLLQKHSEVRLTVITMNPKTNISEIKRAKDSKRQWHFITDNTKTGASHKVSKKGNTIRHIDLDSNAFNDGGEKESGGYVDEDGNFREEEL